MKTWLLASLILTVPAAYAAEPIQGTWRTASGELIEAARCDKQFCLTLKTGEYKGQQIGVLTGTGLQYKGSVTDPKDNKTYSGSANVKTNMGGEQMLEMEGCVLKLLCKRQNWKRVTTAQ